ncbi:LytTR family DNA-binding domain-containing protein [Hymenobacter sp. 15J16-1T3B]|uniref:LytR/AlgR family response regulator transcription factor n=1 Tax=Hymenobacter sp. 15J16-1T3B TaxID=2886941 RepID=UPI001D0F9E3B|nr:LytTR family DNA-binding domain-containing protein [Hymenobacter sp. 15J16-1T3B]MCC3158427.1 LytTR family DNA-binding domain-containing protein [Hymenobacter sp. 15J16-1T3B]
MNVLIVEDEALSAERLAAQLRAYDPRITVLAQLPSVAKAVAWLQAHPAPDLLFLDIHLEDDLSFRILEQVPLRAPVVFTTAYDQYLLDAFRVNGIAYLLKPIDDEELAAALSKYQQLQQHFAAPDLGTLRRLLTPAAPAYKERFMISAGAKLRSVEVADVAYFFSEDKVTFLVTHKGQLLPVDFTLDKLGEMLNPHDFFRVNRQYLVRMQALDNVHVYSAGKYRLELRPPARHEVFVSQVRLSEFKQWMGK